MSCGFVHLHLHTEYSLADSVVRIKPLMGAIAGSGMPAVAMTDQNNMFALVKFYRAALAEGVKPIIGVDALLQGLKEDDPPDRIVLLCKDETGYKNLTRLVTSAYVEGQHGGAPVLERAWLSRSSQGLIALSAAREGDLGKALQTGNMDHAYR